MPSNRPCCNTVFVYLKAVPLSYTIVDAERLVARLIYSVPLVHEVQNNLTVRRYMSLLAARQLHIGTITSISHPLSTISPSVGVA